MPPIDDRDEDDENSFDPAIMQYTRQVYTHLLVCALVAFFLAGGFVGGLAALVNGMQQAEELLAIKPENRAEALEKKITRTQKLVEKQYTDYKAKMQDDSIYAVNKKFEVIYEVSKAGEEDYGKLLFALEDAIYQVASRTRGSGEWYFYYEKELRQFALHQRQREASLNAYLAKK